MKINIIIPALNEEYGIGKTLQGIPYKELNILGYEVKPIVVDNGSTDNTALIAKENNAEVIRSVVKGYGHAIISGLNHADGDILVTADADGTYPLDYLPTIIIIMENNELDFITTNRFAQLDNGAMFLRDLIGNKVLTYAMWLLYGLNIKDSQSGMWIFKREILNHLKLKYGTMALSQELKIEVCYYSKYKWAEIPIVYHNRLGTPKLNKWSMGVTNLAQLIGKRIVR